MSLQVKVAVSAVIERNGKFLLVEEFRDGRKVLNQPTGHVEVGEHPVEAVIREVMEETGLRFEPKGIVGIYFTMFPNGQTYQRIAFTGEAYGDPVKVKDEDVVGWEWLDYDQMYFDRVNDLRNDLVLKTVESYRSHGGATGNHPPVGLVQFG